MNLDPFTEWRSGDFNGLGLRVDDSNRLLAFWESSAEDRVQVYELSALTLQVERTYTSVFQSLISHEQEHFILLRDEWLIRRLDSSDDLMLRVQNIKTKKARMFELPFKLLDRTRVKFSVNKRIKLWQSSQPKWYLWAYISLEDGGVVAFNNSILI